MKIANGCKLCNLANEKIHDYIGIIKEGFYTKIMNLADGDLMLQIATVLSEIPDKLNDPDPIEVGFRWGCADSIRHAFEEFGGELEPELADQYGVFMVRVDAGSKILVSAELARIDAMDISTPCGLPPSITGVNFTTLN